MSAKEGFVTIIGGGLAGCEAAIALSRCGVAVRLFEMKPHAFSPAHKSEDLAELVCSNSLGGMSPLNASGLLKEEMRLLGSVVMEAADETSVPAGQALAVNRVKFAGYITRSLENATGVEIIREEIKAIPEKGVVIIASGPLTSDELAADIARRIGKESLYFYDAISPIVTAQSINWDIAWKADRYGKGSADYVNLPLDEGQYNSFVGALIDADHVPFRPFEKAHLFEGCMPIEEMAARGPQTLAYGPMKPVGLIDPRTGLRPHAVVQLRAENSEATLYNIVGFQTKLKRGEQDRVFRMIPGLEHAEFARWGSLHRNTYFDAPGVLNRRQEFQFDSRVMAAGQLVGVEGYLESSASGIVAGMYAAAKVEGKEFEPPPRTTIIGALLDRIETSTSDNYQPMNANWGIIGPAPKGIRKKEKKEWLGNRSLDDLRKWLKEVK